MGSETSCIQLAVALSEGNDLGSSLICRYEGAMDHCVKPAWNRFILQVVIKTCAVMKKRHTYQTVVATYILVKDIDMVMCSGAMCSHALRSAKGLVTIRTHCRTNGRLFVTAESDGNVEIGERRGCEATNLFWEHRTPLNKFTNRLPTFYVTI